MITKKARLKELEPILGQRDGAHKAPSFVLVDPIELVYSREALLRLTEQLH